MTAFPACRSSIPFFSSLYIGYPIYKPRGKSLYIDMFKSFSMNVLKKTTPLEQRQIILLKKSMDVARLIQCDSREELIRYYRSGMTHLQIVKTLNIQGTYNIKESTAKSAVHLALRGHKAYMGYDPLQPILPIDELERIAKAHVKSAAQEQVKNKIGIFGANEDDKKEWSRRAGLKTFQEGTGVHALSLEEKSTAGKKGGHNATLKRGHVPWKESGLTINTSNVSEKERLYGLVTSEDYIRREGRYEGQPDIEEITNQINLEYHAGKEVRTLKAINRALEKCRRAHGILAKIGNYHSKG